MITSVSNLSALFGTAPVSLGATTPEITNMPPAQGFGEVLSSIANDAVASLKSGEAASIAGIEGKVPARQVVESVLGAERALQTALAVRDKLVSAFQEISRLSI